MRVSTSTLRRKRFTQAREIQLFKVEVVSDFVIAPYYLSDYTEYMHQEYIMGLGLFKNFSDDEI